MSVRSQVPTSERPWISPNDACYLLFIYYLYLLTVVFLYLVHAGCVSGIGATYQDAAMFTAGGYACMRWDDALSGQPADSYSIPLSGMNILVWLFL